MLFVEQAISYSYQILARFGGGGTREGFSMLRWKYTFLVVQIAMENASSGSTVESQNCHGLLLGL